MSSAVAGPVYGANVRFFCVLIVVKCFYLEDMGENPKEMVSSEIWG